MKDRPAGLFPFSAKSDIIGVSRKGERQNAKVRPKGQTSGANREKERRAEPGFSADEIEWLIDVSISDELSDADMADIIGEKAVPVWNQIINLIR